jgi:hypothetical protein
MLSVSSDCCARTHTLSFSSEPDSKKFSIKRVTNAINKIGRTASKISDVAGKVAIVAALI